MRSSIRTQRTSAIDELELVITQSCLPGLREAVGHRCHIERLVDPTNPFSRDLEVYDMQNAKSRACRRFLDNAAEAMRFGRGEGFG